MDQVKTYERGKWSGKLEFLLSCLGFAVGLGNVWRFPYLAYKNGGGAFFIPYCIMLGIVGIPIFFLELSLGQFSSSGPTTCWTFAKLFQGLGFGMVIVSAMVSIYYNMIIAWCIYYIFASFTDKLPWEVCKDEWKTRFLCGYNSSYNFKTNDCASYGQFSFPDGTCRETNQTNGIITAFYDTTIAKAAGIKQKLPTEEYFYNDVLGQTENYHLENFGDMQWKLVLCLLLAWVVVGLALSKGIKTSGKVVYVTATFPYIVLVILLIRGLMLDGYYEGIQFYITPHLETLGHAEVWKDAAVQIFFSLSASWGGLITLSSYNKFKNDVFRDALLVSIGNCLTSVFAGFVIFSYLGFLAQVQNQHIDEIATAGPGLAFIVYPMAVTKLPISPLWSILFFVMLVTLGVDSEFVLTETVVTAIMDMVPRTRRHKTTLVFSICLLSFILGLPLCCQGGIDLLDLVDTYSAGWNVLVIALMECIAVAWVYGVRRFLNDIECMVGSEVCGFMPWVMWKWWWVACWCVLTPAGVVFILIFSWVDYTRIERLPKWADALGWAMTLTVLVAIFGTMVVHLYKSNGTFAQRLNKLTTPLPEWGPALPKDRSLVTRYVPSFIVDPRKTLVSPPEAITVDI